MKEISYIYLNGLGDGSKHWHEKLAMRWWDKNDTPLEHLPVNWYSEPDLDELVESITLRIDELLRTTGRVAIIGSSASGSLAVNLLHANKNKDVLAIIAHGRLAKGSYPSNSHMSLENRAKKSKTFYESVERAEAVIPRLSEGEKQKILVLTQLTDMVVPLETMAIPGTKMHRSLALGHSGGFLAHLIVDRDIIVDFSKSTENP